MVKKFIFKLSSCTNNALQPHMGRDELLSTNHKLYNELTQYKNNITSFHRKRKWEKYKKLSNDYELIYSTNTHFPSISSYHPLSRSYFKLWEILLDMQNMHYVSESSTPVRAVFLADAPGGFVQAFVDYRRGIKRRCGSDVEDKCYAISLRPKDNFTPQWKLSPEFCRDNHVELCYGDNQTGNLCDPSVVNSFVRHVGEGTCELVTADGGFDFSSDFNGQEELSTMLITAEVNAAVRLQKPGGTFVLKIYDIRTLQTMQIINALANTYTSVHMFKPLSSRPANSEKYIIATGFKANGTKHLGPIPNRLLFDIVQYNVLYISYQISCICKTIKYIQDEKTQRDVCKTQLYKAVKWCHKYQIPINLASLHSYKSIIDPGHSQQSRPSCR